MSEHGVVHKTGSYFLMHFDSPTDLIQDIREEYGRDIDIVRRQIYKIEEPMQKECTLAQELLAPAYRKDVKKMIAISKKSEKPAYNSKSGLDYYPFQR